ncbi:MAG: acyl-CoA thioesterase [Deltaproteobacteria bacterium]|nr:acyl-CoA thioesterase [Deltaproteobacteria bacterium]
MPRIAVFTVEELRDAPRPEYGHPVEVRFQDVDGAAIVFYSRFFEYFHDAFAGFLGHHGISLAEAVRSGEWLAPLVHADAEYLSRLRFGDSAVVELVRAGIGRTSLRVGYRIVRGPERVVCAVGQTVHVVVDRQEWRPREVPAEVRLAFETLP